MSICRAALACCLRLLAILFCVFKQVFRVFRLPYDTDS